MPLFGKKDEAEEHFKQAQRYADENKKEFDLTRAIEEFKMAIALKPDEPKYHAALGGTYLEMPGLAVKRQVNVPFRLNESATLALAEYEKAASLSKKHSTSPVNVYVVLGKWEKAIDCAQLAGDMTLVKKVQQLMAEEQTGTETAVFDKFETRKRLEKAVMYRDVGRLKDAGSEFQEAWLVQFPNKGLMWPFYHSWFYEMLCELGERPSGLSQDELKGGGSQ